MIVPTGRQAFTRTASAITYGGHPNKHDYGGIGEVDPLTDFCAAQHARVAEDMASIVNTVPMCNIVVFSVAGSPGTFNVLSCATMWGKRIRTPYAGATPPTGFPTVTNVSGVGGRPVAWNGYTLRIEMPALVTNWLNESDAPDPWFAMPSEKATLKAQGTGWFEFDWAFTGANSSALVTIY